MCDNALDLNSSQINIKNTKWPTNVNCKWVISAEGNNSYLSLEIEEINVSTNGRELLKVIKKVTILKIILYSILEIHYHWDHSGQALCKIVKNVTYKRVL